VQASSLEIYQIGSMGSAWNIPAMASKPGKKADSEKRAKVIYQRLMDLPRDESFASNNNWTKKAGVSTSFFTNLQGTKKPASEPSIGNLRAVLEAAGSSIPEFFLHEAKHRLARAPTRQAIEQALLDAWDEAPPEQERRIAYLASTVLRLLELPADQPASDIVEHPGASDARAKASRPRSATKRA